MNTVEQEIIEKFNQLQPDAQQRVLASIGHGADAQTHSASKFDFAAWWAGRIRPLHDHRDFRRDALLRVRRIWDFSRPHFLSHTL